ncbi:helix-turn-helix domain-containing protein [Nocardia altamirensis]|uniref:helix-turn-helix domain-containing protein n=1 Tax=Nocardia altamirensis TaxID=472158 RepID=UPI000840937B|nr:helix-turn-helix transcriptional regulator [Nocardia altamirensis]
MQDHRSDPSALRFLVGHDLRSAREQAGIKQADAAKIIGCTPTKLSYMESGRTGQQPEEVAALLRSYGVAVEHVERTVQLAGRADHGTWWAPFKDVLPDWFRTFVGLEGLAAAQFAYGILVLPGQLQTPEYCAALLDNSLQIPQMDTAQVIKARMARQRLTDAKAPLQFRAVIEETMLDRIVGGASVMRAQLKHLLKMAERDNVELHVMPTQVTVHDGLPGEFTLLDFSEARSISYVEYHTGALYLQEQDQVHLYSLAADRLCSTALSTSDTVEAIADRIARLA